ncbi:hypothetical protein AURDEDRAFT_156948 [Auricularia subglabra TFB-10046 SS5]|nr:hypothetical protein AURDEDRAFT_156948 [Auricularia subglabra TFB-10046 SS5]
MSAVVNTVTGAPSASNAPAGAAAGIPTDYEVLLFGEFVDEKGKLEAILNRLSLVCEGGSTRVQYSEWHYESQQRVDGVDPSTLVARKEKGAAGWVLHSHSKPEPTRVHPEATVRAATYCNVDGNTLDFVSALGFRLRIQLHKRGYIFRRGPLSITLLQLDQIDSKTRKNITAHPSAPWQVECRAYTKEVPIQQAIEAVLELQLIVKGWLDLARKE